MKFWRFPAKMYLVSVHIPSLADAFSLNPLRYNQKKPSAITMIAFPTPNPTLYIILSHYFKCSRIFALCIRSKRIKIHFVHISLFDPHKCSSLLISLWPMRNPSHVAANIVLLLFHLCPKYNFPWPTFLFEIIFVKIK